MGIGFAAAMLFGGLQPENGRVRFRQRANFLNALQLESRQAHGIEFAFVVESLLTLLL